LPRGRLCYPCAPTYVPLPELRDIHKHIRSCRKAAVELETATFSRNFISSTGGEREPLLEADQEKKETHAENTYLECQLWARSGFGVAPR
jgi:hypothetical protein